MPADLFDEWEPEVAPKRDLFDEWEPSAPAPSRPRFNDELIAALPERERRRLDILSELAAERGRGERLGAEEAELARQERSIERFTPTGILNQPERIMRMIGGGSDAPEAPERFQPGQPLFPVPAPQGTNVMSGLGQLGVGVVNALQTPEMIVTAPAMATPVGRALLAMEMGKEIPGQVERGAQIAGDISTTPAETVVGIGEPIIAGAMTAGLSRVGQIPQRPAELGPIIRADAMGLKKSARAAADKQAVERIEDASKVTEATEVHGDVREQPVEGQRQVPVEEGQRGIQPSAEAAPGEVLLKPKLVAAIKTPSGKTYTGERHPFALQNAMDEIRSTGGAKAGEMAAELADAQQGFLDVETGQFLTRAEAAQKMGATGELTSEMLPESELKANVAELSKKQTQPKSQNVITKETVPERVVVQPPEDVGGGEMTPGYVTVQSKGNAQSGAPDAWTAAGHELPDFSKLPKGTYGIEEARALAKAAQEIPFVEVGIQQEMASGLPEAKTSSGKGKPATPKAEFDALLKEYGEQLGWIQNPDAIAGKTPRGGQESTASIKGRVAGDKELAAARRKAIDDLGGGDVAALLPKLKERIASFEKLESVPMETLPEGATFTILGEKYTVKGTDANTEIVTLKDGRTLKVDMRGSVKIDPGSLKGGKVSTEFVPKEVAPPKLGAGEKGTGDLFKGEEQPFNLAGERGIDMERVATERAAAEQRAAEAQAATARQQPELPTRAAAFFERESEAQGLGRSSLPPTVEDVRAQRARDAGAAPTPTQAPPVPPAPANHRYPNVMCLGAVSAVDSVTSFTSAGT